jgi:hypothetical protein
MSVAIIGKSLGISAIVSLWLLPPNVRALSAPSRSALLDQTRRQMCGSRVLLVLRSAHPFSRSFFFAHVCTILRGSITLGPAEMVDLRIQIDPHNGIRRTASLSLRFG